MLEIKKTQKGLMEERNFILKRRMVSSNFENERVADAPDKKTHQSKKSNSKECADSESLGSKKKKFE